MLRCPVCQDAPSWHFQCNTSWREKRDLFRFMPACLHGEALAKEVGVVASADRAAVEARWDDFAAKLFDKYTERWTEPQRVAYRAKLYPPPPADYMLALNLDSATESAKGRSTEGDEPAF